MKSALHRLSRVALPATATRHPSRQVWRCRPAPFSSSSSARLAENIDAFPLQPLPRKEEALSAAEPISPSSPHAVVSVFDLFSIGVGPSSSHTVGPMRAARIFVQDLKEQGLLDRVSRLKVALYGSLAATGKGHLSPQALVAGFEGSDCETVDPESIPGRYDAVVDQKFIVLGGHSDDIAPGSGRKVEFDTSKDLVWLWDSVLPMHPNGMLFSVYDANGDLLATNTYYSVGGGFVINERTQIAQENMYFKEIDKVNAAKGRLDPAHASLQNALPLPEGHQASEETTATADSGTSDDPPFPFHSADSLLQLTREHNLTIAQIVYNNELRFHTHDEIREKLMKIWAVMDEAIHKGVTSTEDELPGGLGVKRRARNLYRRLHRGFFPTISDASRPPPPALSFTKTPSAQSDDLVPSPSPPTKANDNTLTATSNATLISRGPSRAPLVIRGRFDHAVPPIHPRRTTFPSMDWLSVYAIAVNEVNAAGGRIVTAPTNGAAGVIPAVLKYFLEFISDDPERDIMTFLLTAAAIGMLYKRGATISAAEGGCMAEVGTSTSMAAAAFAACQGGSPEIIEAAAEIGIEHCLGLTCDPIGGLVAIPCIERNALGAVKAVTAAQLALSVDGQHSVSLDEAIAAMRETAKDMNTKYKETSRAGLATNVRGARIPVSVPDC